MTITTKVLIDVDGTKVWASKEQADTIQTLSETRKGGFAKVYGYRPSSNVIKAPVLDISMVTRFSTAKLYERRNNALRSLAFADVAEYVAKDEKLSKLSTSDALAAFHDRLNSEIESHEKTLNGERDDAHRQGHDRCYLPFGQGVKIHYVTAKGADGLKYPVLTDGFPTVDSIMVHYLENSRTVREEGEYKTVNSGIPVRMGNAINSVVNKRSVVLKMLTLKEGNFERLVMDNNVILNEDVAGLV